MPRLIVLDVIMGESPSGACFESLLAVGRKIWQS